MSSESLPAFDHSSEWKFTQPPNPEFRFGQKVEETPEGREWLKGLESGWEVIDTSKTESVPLPVASLVKSNQKYNYTALDLSTKS